MYVSARMSMYMQRTHTYRRHNSLSMLLQTHTTDQNGRQIALNLLLDVEGHGQNIVLPPRLDFLDRLHPSIHNTNQRAARL
jgi:hypothetical protein